MHLLIITAHPDDECFAFGGLLALAALRGHTTSVVCLTDGQAATHRGNSTSAADLGRIRRDEFAASCRVLNVTHAELLNFHDATLEHQPLATLAAPLVERIRRSRPHLIFTFGLEGGANAHPDHTAASAAAAAAFHWSGNPKRLPDLGAPWQPRRFYTQTSNWFLPDRHRPAYAPATLTLNIAPVLPQKLAAFREHPSQSHLLPLTEKLFQEHGHQELYHLSAQSA